MQKTTEVPRLISWKQIQSKKKSQMHKLLNTIF